MILVENLRDGFGRKVEFCDNFFHDIPDPRCAITDEDDLLGLRHAGLMERLLEQQLKAALPTMRSIAHRQLARAFAPLLINGVECEQFWFAPLRIKAAAFLA